MIVENNFDNDFDDVPSQVNRTIKSISNFKEFFASLKNKIADSSLLLMGKDSNSDFTYIISNPLLILNSFTFEIVQKIKYPEKLKLEDYTKILHFIQDRQNFIMIYSSNSIFIFPLEMDKVNFDICEQRLTFLKENERIVKMYCINNEVNIPYFIIVSSTSKIYFLRLKIEKNLESFDFEYEELNEKINFLRKFISNFVPSFETSKIFILNPFSYTKYLKNNKKNNILFLFNENYLKKVDFSVTTKGIEPEVRIL